MALNADCIGFYDYKAYLCISYVEMDGAKSGLWVGI